MRAKWQADDLDAFAAQEERRSPVGRAKRGGVVVCGVVASYLEQVLLVMDTPVYRVPLQFGQLVMTLLYRVMVVTWLSVLVVAMPALRLSYSKLEH